MYQPYIFKLKPGDSSILDNKFKKEYLIMNTNINYPLHSLGFHAFIHKTKSSMSITESLQTKNKIYYVINPFEHNILNYEDSLSELSKKYLNLSDINISSRAFFKMWEMLYMFEIADSNKLFYAAIAEAPGSFVQAAIFYREKLINGVKNDKINCITLHPEGKNKLQIENKITNYYNKNYKNLVNIHKTYSFQESIKDNNKDNGDITKCKTIELFKKDFKNTFANLITADGGFTWEDENNQEQEAYILILSEILTALNVQDKNGHFILKIFEIFTMVTIKLIYLISSFYEEVYIYKPYFSRISNSEKYLICKKFKYDQNSDILKKKINSLQELLNTINSNPNKFIFDIYPELIIDNEYINKIKFINIKLCNSQLIMINKIVKYIKENNYFGEKYHMYRNTQIEATKWWTNLFFPVSNNLYELNKEEIKKLILLTLEKNEVEESNFRLNIL